jgi:hypothetical protein
MLDHHLALKDPPKFTNIGIFGLKISGNPGQEEEEEEKIS